jgi:DNA ligase-associated metallophosphoesterase
LSLAARHHAYDFSPHASGGLRLAVAGLAVVCRASGALWLEDAGALIVADLHLEKGSAYAARGQFLPPYDTRETLARLEAEVAALAPETLVFLGDSFHDSGGEERLAAEDSARLEALAAGRRLVWVVGNHDTEGPRRLPGDVAPDLAFPGLALVHAPAHGPAPGEIAGHLHPCARVQGRGGSVRRRCFVTDGERLILPAFGAYAGGLNIRDAAFGALFTRRPLAAVLGAGRLHPVGWDALRGD